MPELTRQQKIDKINAVMDGVDIALWMDAETEGFNERSVQVLYGQLRLERLAAAEDVAHVATGEIIRYDTTLELPVIVPDGLLKPRAKT